jgi:predicted nucleic acid-binding protein
VILLDTNVVSEPLRPRPDPQVIAWLDGQAAETLYLTATSLAELLVGIEFLPVGRRRKGLESALSDLIGELFESRVLPFDAEAARRYAAIIGRASAAGRALSVGDGQIAAIANQHGFTVATRDLEPFLAAGVAVVNPWDPL